MGRHNGQNLSGHKSGSVPIPLPQMAKASLLQQHLTTLYIVLYNFNLREPSFPTLVRDRKAGLGWASLPRHLSSHSLVNVTRKLGQRGSSQPGPGTLAPHTTPVVFGLYNLRIEIW